MNVIQKSMIAVLSILVITGVGLVVLSDDSYADTIYGTAEAPETEIDNHYFLYRSVNIFIETGSKVTITDFSVYPIIGDFTVTPGFGLTVQNKTVSGTLVGTGVVTITAENSTGPFEMTLTVVDKVVDRTYHLNFDANGGSNAPANLTATSTEKTYTFTIPDQVPNPPAGKVFMYWNYDGYRYQPGDTIVVKSTNNLRAEYGYGFTLHYDANGGSGAPVDDTFVDHNQNHSFKISDQQPTKPGHNFLGWAETADASIPISEKSINLNYSNSPKTLYAVWEAIPMTLTVNLDANGGTDCPPSFNVVSDSPVHDGTYVFDLLFPEQIPTREGYTFLGWSDSSTATEPMVSVDRLKFPLILTSVSPDNTSVTYYAVWDIPECTFMLDYDDNPDGSSMGFTIELDHKTEKALEHTFTVTSTIPTKVGYTFVNWINHHTGQTYSAGDQITLTSSEPRMVLSAVWSVVENTFYLNYTGSGTDTPDFDSITVKEKAVEHSFVITDVVPTLPGQKFTGWKDVRTGNIYNSGDTIVATLSFSQINLESTWEVTNNTFKISYCNIEGGAAYFEDVFTAQSTVHKFIVSSEIPVKEGFKFLGWSDVDSTTVTHNAGDEIHLTAKYPTKTLYAVWEQVTEPPSPNQPENGNNGGNSVKINSVWDELSALLTDPIFLIAVVIGVFLLASYVRRF